MNKPPEIMEEPLVERVRVGDREVDRVPYSDGSTLWGSGPGYLLHLSEGRWTVFFDYRKVVIENSLSRRSPHWRALFNEVEFLHVVLVNDPQHRAAGNSAVARWKIRRAVTEAIRNLDSSILRQLADTVDAVKTVRVEQRDMSNERLIDAIRLAANCHKKVPLRCQVQEMLEKIEVARAERQKSTWTERYQKVGFGWLPGGQLA